MDIFSISASRVVGCLFAKLQRKKTKTTNTEYVSTIQDPRCYM